MKLVAGIGQDAYEEGNATVAKTVAKRVGKRETVVLCSHGPLLPELLQSVAKAVGTKMDDPLKRAAMLSTGEYSVLHLSAEDPEVGIVAIETHGPLTV